jgi:hypothetical protein
LTESDGLHTPSLASDRCLGAGRCGARAGSESGGGTFVFQEGHGASLIGLDGPVPIASYVPLLMFAILFGLSMDYEVFLLTQIQEHYKRAATRTTRWCAAWHRPDG